MKKSFFLLIVFVFAIVYAIAQSPNRSGYWNIEYETIPNVNSNYGPNQFNFMLKKINLISLSPPNSGYELQPINQTAAIVHSNFNISNNQYIFYFMESNTLDTLFVNIPFDNNQQDTLVGTVYSVYGGLKVTLIKSAN